MNREHNSRGIRKICIVFNLSREVQMTLGSISLTEGLVKHYDRLPRDMVNAPGLSVFKRHLDIALNALKL